MFVSLKEAKKLVCDSHIVSAKEYRSWVDRPANLPFAPHLYYRGEWSTWCEFFGKSGKVEFASFEEARETARKARIKTCDDYRNWKNRPKNMPSNPILIYKNKGWTNWKDFLATNWIPYEEAKKIAVAMNVEKADQYREMVRLGNYENLPIAPDKVYKNRGWTGWKQFLKNI